jgi:hypothetical protein
MDTAEAAQKNKTATQRQKEASQRVAGWRQSDAFGKSAAANATHTKKHTTIESSRVRFAAHLCGLHLAVHECAGIEAKCSSTLWPSASAAAISTAKSSAGSASGCIHTVPLTYVYLQSSMQPLTPLLLINQR